MGLCLPNIRWLGVQSHHLDPAIKRSNGMEACREPQLQGWMQLTPRDRAKAIRMLEWSVCSERGAEPVWRQELQNMLKFNRKAEMQILDELQPGLVQWLANALLASDSLDGVLQSGTTLDDGMLF